MVIEISDKEEGYINESFEDLINRLPKRVIFKRIIFMQMELRDKISEERKRELTERIEYCIKKLKGDKLIE